MLQNNVGEPTWGEGSYILGHQPGFSHQPSCHVIISYRTHWSSSAPSSSPSNFKGFAESLWFCLWLLQSQCLVFCQWRNVGEISTEGSRRRWRLLAHAHYWPKCLVMSRPYCPYCQLSSVHHFLYWLCPSQSFICAKNPQTEIAKYCIRIVAYLITHLLPWQT